MCIDYKLKSGVEYSLEVFFDKPDNPQFVLEPSIAYVKLP